MGIFFDNRIFFRSFWSIDFISKYFSSIFYFHILLNAFAVFSSIAMLMSVKYYQVYGGTRQSFIFINENKISSS